MSDRTSVSPSAGRRSFSESISSIGTKLTKIVSTDQDGTRDRSQSRGRNTNVVITSSGRGGAGNIRSVSRDPTNALNPPYERDDDENIPRGREVQVSYKALSSGRGGAGNIRPPQPLEELDSVIGRGLGSRSKSRGHDAVEREVIARRIAQEETSGVFSSGRGGAGNITSRSKSRDATAKLSTSPPPAASRSTGRGGAGNILPQASPTAIITPGFNKQDYEEAKAHANKHSVSHSTGRGGAANITSLPSPPIDIPPPVYSPPSSGFYSSGRGGAGNIVTKVL